MNVSTFFKMKSLLPNILMHTRTHSHMHTRTHTQMQILSQRIDDPCDVNECVPCLVVRPKKRSSICSVRCKCHVKVKDKTAKRAKIKLVIASMIALGFMTGEVVGKLSI